jgi:hypothetical protein
MKIKSIYWIATVILALIYLGGGAYYLSNMAEVQRIYLTLGYPPYLVPILAFVKPLGALTILSRFNVALSDLAYAGMLYHLLLALLAHINAGQVAEAAPALVGLLALTVSFATQNAARRKPSPNSLTFGATSRG